LIFSLYYQHLERFSVKDRLPFNTDSVLNRLSVQLVEMGVPNAFSMLVPTMHLTRTKLNLQLVERGDLRLLVSWLS
jgi:hypothetical protein